MINTSYEDREIIMFIAMLLKNWQLVIIAMLLATIAGISIYVSFLKRSTEQVKAEKQVLIGELKISQASVKTLQNSIDEQNTAIEKLKSDAAERAKTNASALAKAKQDAMKQREIAKELMKVQRDTSLSACEDANNLFNSVLKK